MTGLHPVEAIEARLTPSRKLRVVALVDVVKAVAILAAGFGILEAHSAVLEHGGRGLLAALSLDAGGGTAAQFLALLRGADHHHGLLATVAAAYAAIRLAEAYGLWFGRAWARWLGLASAALYIPFELAYLVRQPSAASVGVLAVNVAVLWLLWPLRAGAT